MISNDIKYLYDQAALEIAKVLFSGQIETNRSSNNRDAFRGTGEWRLFSSSIIQDIPYMTLEVTGYELASYISIIIFIGFNLTCYISIAAFYIQIFQLASNSSKSVQSSAKQNEMKMAIKMSSVVLTGFFCRVPLSILCVLVQCGVFTVGPETYVWIVGLILPINSSLNPFLYTLGSTIADCLE